MNKQEGNKIIAGFMGVETYFWQGQLKQKSPPKQEWNGQEYEDAMVIYHESWDWLMPVVKKIDQLDGITSYVEGYYKSWGTSYSNVISGHYVNEMDIGDVWEGCVEFIKWYNENEV